MISRANSLVMKVGMPIGRHFLALFDSTTPPVSVAWRRLALSASAAGVRGIFSSRSYSLGVNSHMPVMVAAGVLATASA